jgi:hypothetical protein
VLCFLWIRAEDLKNNGRHEEAMQLADLICSLEPNFAGVWSYHGWNMAYNISVQTHTPEERWRWVWGGIKLIRDRGIPQNRKSVQLYKDLSQIFWHKIGEYSDQMQLYYKRYLAGEMQRVLGAPPYGTSRETLDWFRPMSEAPIDRDPRRQGQRDVQLDQLRIVLADAGAAALHGKLQAAGVEAGWDLVDVYDRFTDDRDVQYTRVRPPRIDSDLDRELSALINDPANRAGLDKLLAFTRAQLLWNVYRMDPRWMYQLMERFGPLDWRISVCHALYWSSYGLHYCQAVKPEDIDTLNTDRIVMSALKYLTRFGRYTCTENPDNPDLPNITWGPDWRFIDPTQREYIALGKKAAENYGTTFDANPLFPGHINYLAYAINMLYTSYHRAKAQELLDYIKTTYNPRGPEWSMDLGDFVVYRLNNGGQPTGPVAYSQIDASLTTAFIRKVLGDPEGYRQSVRYARRVYDLYCQGIPDRNRPPAFQALAADVAANLLVVPRQLGVDLTLIDRSNLYGSLDLQTQQAIYDAIAPSLSRECATWGIDFDKAFPLPPGMDEFRRERMQTTAPPLWQ